MPRKQTRKSVKRKLISVFNRYIRERDKKIFGDKCPLCYLRGRPPGKIENAGHWQTAAWESTKFDEENCTGICASCNINMEHDKDFMVHCIDWYKKLYGTAQWDTMVLRSHTPIKRSLFDFKEMTTVFEHKIENLLRGAIV